MKVLIGLGLIFFGLSAFAVPSEIDEIPQGSTLTFEKALEIPANSSGLQKTLVLGSAVYLCDVNVNSEPFVRTIAQGESFTVIKAYSQYNGYNYQTEGILVGRKGKTEMNISCFGLDFNSFAYANFSDFLETWIGAKISLAPAKKF